jgi:hypothetical protein
MRQVGHTGSEFTRLGLEGINSMAPAVPATALRSQEEEAAVRPGEKLRRSKLRPPVHDLGEHWDAQVA